MPPKNPAIHRRIPLQSVLTPLLGIPFHLLLFIAANDSQDLFGAQGELTAGVSYFGIALLLLVFFLLILPAWRGRRATVFRVGVVTFAPIPLYLLILSENPGLGLTGILYCFLQSGSLRRFRAHPGLRRAELALLAALGSLTVALLTNAYHLISTPAGLVFAWEFAIISLLLVLAIEMPRFKEERKILVEDLLSVLVLVFLLHPKLRQFTLSIIALRLVVVAIRFWLRHYGVAALWEYLAERPAQLLVLSFALVIFCGTVLLTLPVATADEGGMGLLNALFTATSATCVTGLIVVDTGTYFTVFGQLTILALIQIGGLGIMTISVFIALVLGRRVGLRSEFAIGEMIGEERNRLARRLLYFIVLITLTIELIGAIVLSVAFRGATDYSWLKSVYYGVFHSISAFCNAGFAFYGNSFVDFNTQPLFPIVISSLIILGGIGFGVLYTLVRLPGSRSANYGAHVKLVLATTFVLLVGGTLFVWLVERDHSLAGLGFRDSLINAWFQSVTTRTAGFNTVDLTKMHPASNLVFNLLMFIGAAPGSTGGGVKVTTIVVLFLLLRSILNGREEVVAFGRRIEVETVLRATALVSLGMVLVLVGSSLLLISDPELRPGKLFFEAVSAFGTVGLSLGVTDRLSSAGRLVIILLMFVGRVGPLTLLVTMRPSRRSSVSHPSARVMIG